MTQMTLLPYLHAPLDTLELGLLQPHPLCDPESWTLTLAQPWEAALGQLGIPTQEVELDSSRLVL